MYRLIRIRIRILILSSIFLIGFMTGCASTDFHTPDADASGLKRIAVIHIAQETNSFSTVLTTLAEFESRGLYYGEDIFSAFGGGKNAVAGAMEAAAKLGEGRVELVPILSANAMSGGPLEAALYERFKEEMIEGLGSEGKLDGIYMVLHGAMGVEGMRDPEGDLLEAARSVVGDIPIGISHDLHANITRRRAELADFIIGYKTNPHRDHFETGYHSMQILIDTVFGKINPVMEIRKIPMLTGGGMEVDFLSPMNKVFSWMKKRERDYDVLAISNFMVHIWLDDEELGWTSVAVTDGDRELAASIADELAMMDWAVKDVHMPERLTAAEAIEKAEKKKFARLFGPMIICDSADAVGAGAPGENTWILRELIDSGTELRVHLPLRDRKAAIEAYSAEIGDELSLSLGGSLDTVYNRPLDFTGSLVSRHDTRYGKTAVVRHENIYVVLTELAAAVNGPEYFTDIDLGVWNADLLVVKNLFPFRYKFLLQNRGTLNVETPGTTSVNVYELDYQQVPRPVHPLDEMDLPF